MKKNIKINKAGLIMLMAIILIMAPLGITADEPEGPKVLFLRPSNHVGNSITSGLSSFANALTTEGYVVAEINAISTTITDTMLADYDVVVFPTAESRWISTAEADALFDFVDNGGGLYAVGERAGTQAWWNDAVNRVVTKCAMSVVDGYIWGYVTLSEHKITDGITSCYYYISSTITLPVGGIQLAHLGSDLVLGCLDTGTGRIVLAGGIVQMNNTYTNNQNLDNLQLNVNIINWLANIPQPTDIDVKPGSSQNPISLKSKGVLPVGIMTTDTFDATTINPDTILIGDVAPVHYAIEDLDEDGDNDMVVQFKITELIDAGILALGVENVTLTAKNFDGDNYIGIDNVRIIGH